MAEAAAAAGLVQIAHGSSVNLAGEGLARGASKPFLEANVTNRLSAEALIT